MAGGSSSLNISKWLAGLSPGAPMDNGLTPPGAKPQPGAIAGLASAALGASWGALTFPYSLGLRWLSWAAALAIQALALLGAPPSGYVAQSKVRELNSIIEHMHIREDLYRKTIKELQASLDAKDHDKKRALRRLKSTKAELEMLQQQVAELQDQYRSSSDAAAERAAAMGGAAAAAGGGGGGVLAAGGAVAALHSTVALLLALVWWFYQQDCHAIQRKLVFAVLAPVLWTYVTTLLSRRPPTHPLLLHSLCWALIGFVGAYKFSQATAP